MFYASQTHPLKNIKSLPIFTYPLSVINKLDTFKSLKRKR